MHRKAMNVSDASRSRRNGLGHDERQVMHGRSMNVSDASRSRRSSPEHNKRMGVFFTFLIYKHNQNKASCLMYLIRAPSLCLFRPNLEKYPDKRGFERAIFSLLYIGFS